MIVFNQTKFVKVLRENVDDLVKAGVITRHQFKMYNAEIGVPRMDTYIKLINALGIQDMNYFFLTEASTNVPTEVTDG